MIGFDLLKSLSKNSSLDTGIYFIQSHERKTFLSYKQLYEDAHKTLCFLQAQGLKKGDELIFQLNDNQLFVKTFWACLLGGIIPVPLHAAMTSETRLKLINCWNHLNHPALIADEKTYDSLKQKLNVQDLKGFSEPRFILMNQNSFEFQNTANLDQITENQLAFVQFSSGSTGSPKGVTLTHENLLSNIDAIIQGANLSASDSTLGWMPLTHDLGLIGFHLTPLVCGINQYIIDTDIFVRRPGIWIDQINEYRVTFTASPNFGYKHFLAHRKNDDSNTWDLSCVKRILNGAEPISVEVASEFLDALSSYGLKRESMFPVYGMAEASLAISFPQPDKEFTFVNVSRENLQLGHRIQFDNDGISIPCVGKPVAHCEVQICDELNIPLEEDRIGAIFIKGKNVTQSYYNNPLETEKTITASGWLNTGDIGFFHNSNLYITGRSKDIIFSNGLNLYPHDLERICEEIDGITQGRIVFTGVFNSEKGTDELVCFVVFRGNLEKFTGLSQEIRQLISKKISLDVDYIIPVNAIPKTTSGKVQRYLLGDQFKSGLFTHVLEELKTLSNQREVILPETKIQQQLMEMWNCELNDSIKSIRDNFFEYGGNSLKASLLLGKIAKEFNIELSIREFFKNPNIESLSELIATKNTEEFIHIPVVSNRKYYPCSSAQKRLYILHELDPERTNYNITTVHRLNGVLDVNKITQTFQLLVDRHEILRTNFINQQGEPVQVIHDNLKLNCKYEECSLAEIQATIKSLVKPFQLESEPLFRLHMLRETDSENHYLFFDVHHIVLDGFSLNQLVREFSKLYNGELTEYEAVKFKDFAVWEADFLQTAKLKNQEQFWLSEFNTLPSTLDLQTDFKRSKLKDKTAASLKIQLDHEVFKLMTKTAEKEELTYFNLFVAAYSVLLHKYTGNGDFVIGTPVINRPHVDLQHTLGTFINTLSFRSKPNAEKSLQDFLQEIKEKSIDLFSNQNYPFEQLIEHLDIERELNRNPLFDVFFVFQNANDSSIQLNDLSIEKVSFENSSTKFDLNVHASEQNGTFELFFEYDSELFRAETIEQMSRHFKEIMVQICQAEKSTIAEISLLNALEKTQIEEKNAGKLVELSAGTALEKFKHQCSVSPDQLAIHSPQGSFTYAELDRISNFYAQQLTEQGIVKNQLVGISFSAYEKVIFAVLAIWKTGACYVPIDPNNPSERNEYIISNSGLKLLFSDKKHPEIHTIDLDISQNRDVFEPVASSPHDPAYLIYTSGTTGYPKGTSIKHRSLVNYTDWLLADFGIGKEHSSLLLSSYAFDLGYTSIFGCLLNGGCLHIVSEEDRKEPAMVLEYILKHKLTYIKTTPSQLFTFLNSTKKELISQFDGLHYIFIGGEAIKTSDLKILNGLNARIQIINHYGPTESTVGCIANKITNLERFSQEPTIGLPIQNVSISILNSELQLVPDGVCGELCISGEGLSSGYLNNETQTKEKFIFLESGKRIYRTGDLAKRLPNGEIVLLGRNDDQVKIRGYRVELAEIEKNLQALNGIQEALVLVQKDHAQQEELIAYVVAEHPIEVRDLKNQLKRTLPAFMVPEHLIQIQEIPLTANGKLDKQKLPKITSQTNAVTEIQIADYTESQKKLHQIWKELLQVEHISLQDNFFNLGGHSLKATLLVSRIHKEFEIELKLKDVFEYPTLEELDQLLKTKEIKAFLAIEPAPVQETYPLTSAQQRMYVLHEIQPDSLAYNMSGAFVLTGNLELTKLREAFHRLIERHESLRTSFEVQQEELVQRIQNDFTFEIENLGQTTNPEQTIRNFIKPFDLKQAPLFRVGLAKITNSANHLLVFDIHHIISDGTSMGIIIRDFTAIYDGMNLEPLGLQYKDFAVWQDNYFKSSKFEEQKNYWINKFNDSIPLLDLDTDFIRPDELKGTGSNFTYKFDKDLSKKLKAFVEKHQTTLFIALTSCYSLLISKKSKQDDLVIGTPIAGRFHHDLQQLIGVFLNMLPLRIKLNMELSFSDFLKANHDQFIHDFENQNFPFDRLIDELNFERNLNRNPLFDTMLVVQNMDLNELKTNDLTFTPFEFDLGISQLDLSLVVFEQQDELDFTVEFNTELFKKESIYELMQEFELLVNKVISNDQFKLKNYDLLSDDARDTLLSQAYSNYQEIPEVTIIDEILAGIEQYKTRIAVRDFESQLTYEELGQHIASVQEYLFEQGIQKGDVVAVYMESDINLLGIIYAILASGAVYLPLDPMYPEQRIEYMLKDSACKLMITNLQEASFAVKMCQSSSLKKIGSAKFTNHSKPDDRAYIIYTSGTTGTPKGVLIKHKSLVDYISTFNDLIGVESTDCVIHQSSISFDTSMEELFPAIVKGGSIFIVNHKKNLNLIVDAIETGYPTLLTTSPLVLSFVNQSLYDYKSLKHILSGGDELKSEHLTEIPEHIHIWNGYGPTESTVCITFKKIDRSEHLITLGVPIRNRHVFVMDPQQNLLPKGALGELCVSGAGLAEAYLNAEEQTAAKFIPNPYRSDELIYRTGDLVKWNHLGELEYFGRIDKQVKIRGYRIELGEITNSLLAIPGVQDCYVRILESESDKILVAYYTSELQLSEKQLINELSDKLPAYMIPSHLIAMSVLPINQNGKIDEKALPEPMLEYETDSDYELSESELILSDAIKLLLKRTKLAIQASFFEIGGDSIKAIQLVNALQQKGYKLEVKQIFEAKSIRELALKLTKSAIDINQDEQQGMYALTPIQSEFFAMNYHNPSYYNQSFALSSKERPDLEKVNRAYQKIIAHHDNLRTIFVRNESKWQAKIQPYHPGLGTEIKIETVESQEALYTAFEKAQTSLDIEQGILFTCFVFNLNQKSILFFVCHHLLVDAVSWRIILEDFVNLYADDQYQIPLKTSGMIDFSNAVQQYAQQKLVLDELPLWKHAENKTQNSLFGDASGKIENAGVFEFTIDEELTEQLIYEANKVYNTKPEDLLLSALMLTFKEWKNCDKIQIDLEAHGRVSFDEKININRTVGWFTSVFPVQLEVKEDLSRTIIENKDYLHKIPKKGFHFLLLKNLSSELVPELHKSEVLYNFLGEIGQEDAASVFSIYSLSDVPQIDKKNQKEYPFEINQFVKNKQLHCKLNYSNTINSSEIESFKELYTFKLLEIVNYCLGKETTEITQSDLSFDINSDDFENIFNL